MKSIRSTFELTLGLIALIAAAIAAYGNGGPFIVKYPNGDPGAKGIMARLDPLLRPANESRLRVVREDLSFRFIPQTGFSSDDTSLRWSPLVNVRASYIIENPTKEEILIDFGFPILRGIGVRLGSKPTPDVNVTVDGESLLADIISNSKIYSIIRQHARNTIEQGIKADHNLAQQVALVRKASGNSTQAKENSSQQIVRTDFPAPTEDYESASKSLRTYLIAKKGWNDRDAALMIEFARLDFDVVRQRSKPVPSASALIDNLIFGPPSSGTNAQGDRLFPPPSAEIIELINQSSAIEPLNLGPLVAIGEQKATQFFALLASRFDKNALTNYEEIFAAWGGDVRERSVDMSSGQVRPREIAKKMDDWRIVDLKDVMPKSRGGSSEDSTIYARLDYLDPDYRISETEKGSCLAVLRNLPVVFTFAPMNLVHYQVSFPPGATRNVTVSYAQYAYLDTRENPSYQLAYVLHPASLWKDFGPIHVRIQVPHSVTCRASIDLSKGTEDVVDEQRLVSMGTGLYRFPSYTQTRYEALLTDRKERMGELFLAINKAEWERFSNAQWNAKIKQ
jgi:hypothetical protein